MTDHCGCTRGLEVQSLSVLGMLLGLKRYTGFVERHILDSVDETSSWLMAYGLW